jgi:quercetin dioxygenase-like cupin family protein
MGDAALNKVFSANELEWKNLRGLPGARGFEFKALSDASYTDSFNTELVRLEPGDHSVPHVEPWNHLLYFMSGTGDIIIDGVTSLIAPGSVALVKAGEKHALRNLGKDDMILIAIYDPPRTRAE